MAVRLTRARRRALATLFALALAGAAPPDPAPPTAPAPGATAAAAPAPPATAAPLVLAHRTIATVQPVAQAEFDRGLLMLEAFNAGQARDDFRAAEATDPHAVMAYVGEATAQTIDINLPSTPAGEIRGADAVTRGRKAESPQTPPDERALLDATARRFDRRLTQTQRFQAYADALDAYAHAYPADAVGWELAAFARWNATGDLTAGPSNTLTPDAQAIRDDLDTALRLAPNDPGVHHLRIHFWEMAQAPERALADARALDADDLPVGTSHLEHMPAHIYDRLGMYDAMIDANERALANDAAYDALGDGDGQRYMRNYHDHDIEFVAYGLTTLGRDDQARMRVRDESIDVRERVALRTHDNAGVLALLGDAVTPLRVVAEARLGREDAGAHDLAALSRASPRGRDLAQAALARARHDPDAAVAAYRRVLAAQGANLGDPKDDWWEPAGEGLGAALCEAHRYAEAETVFREQLVRYPDDPHLEYGLATVLAAQGRDDASPRQAYRAHWHGAAPLSMSDLG